MPEILEKLRPDRDLQCYFERPSAIAALSQTSSTGFTASGSWRQQFDWMVIEWNRDNVFEHPLFRYLPDGNLSGLTLSYEDTRSNCILFDSDLYPTVEWPHLRIWSVSSGVETLYKVRLKDYAVPVAGSYQSATAVFQLQGTPTSGDYITLAWLDEHYTWQLSPTDTLETAAQRYWADTRAFEVDESSAKPKFYCLSMLPYPGWFKFANLLVFPAAIAGGSLLARRRTATLDRFGPQPAP